MDERLITIIKEPHLAFSTFKRDDGYKVYTLSWCKYKVLSAEEIDVGTRIRIRSAQDDIELTWRAFPDDFLFAPWLVPIDSEILQTFIKDEMRSHGYDMAKARSVVFNILKKDIDNPLITKDVRDALSSEIDDIVDVDVCRLPFSVRLINVLRNADINTLGDLLRVNKISLIELNGLGKKCLDEIKDYYAANGYDFGTEFLEWERGRGHYLPKKQQ
jgi:hypothetical protein